MYDGRRYHVFNKRMVCPFYQSLIESYPVLSFVPYFLYLFIFGHSLQARGRGGPTPGSSLYRTGSYCLPRDPKYWYVGDLRPLVAHDVTIVGNLDQLQWSLLKYWRGTTHIFAYTGFHILWYERIPDRFAVGWCYWRFLVQGCFAFYFVGMVGKSLICNILSTD